MDTAAPQEQAIIALVRRQHGVVTRDQLRSLGLSPDAIRTRLRQGRLRRVHHGVYLAGPVVPPLAREMAAVLACGPRAALSHRDAAVLWGLARPPARPADVHVTVVARNPRPKRGVRIHRVEAGTELGLRSRQRVPVTGPARTLLDLAAGVREPELEQAVAEALGRGLIRLRHLNSLLARNPRHRGATALRLLLEAEAPHTRTASEAERRFLALVRKGGLPAPETGVAIRSYEVDFLWREERLVVEVDGFRFHSSRPAFERDRRRDAELQAAGYRVIRVTWRQLEREPEAVLVRLTRALEAAA